MTEPDSTDDPEEQAVTVTEHGQVTIPKRFQEMLGIDAPGKALFRETQDGEIVLERIPSPSEIRGFAARNEASTDEPATELLQEKREDDTTSDPTGGTTSDWRLSEWSTGRTQDGIDAHRELLERADDLGSAPRTGERDE